MFRFLLGVLVGSVATALYLDGSRVASSGAAGGRVDEVGAAANNVVADPELNAGDGTASKPQQARA